MNFNQISFLPGVLVATAVLIVIVIMLEKKFFNFIKTYWFYNRSLLSYAATFFFLSGMTGLLISLLDIRGPEEKMKTEVPQDRTIILIDTSASMLAEDVKPSRLKKATLIAKHFARKAAGHQISIVAFAEIQKKIVPFTNDLDLIDSRLDSIENLRNQYGSSALSLAIQESVQYFREAGGEARGNILVLTDGEETAEGINLKIPKDVFVAFVGIGTENGGRIPLDDGRGFRFGYKKERGRDVITKLNEKFFKQVSAEIPTAKYWLANSYTLPSEEILDFFQSEKVKNHNQQDMVIKPVMMEWIVVPSLMLLLLSYLFKAIRVFSLTLLLLVYSPAFAQDEKEIELSPEVLSRMDELQRGELNQLEKIKLADDLHKAGAKEEALALYEENLPDEITQNIPTEAYLNHGTALLEEGKIQEGMSVYQKLSDSLDRSPQADRYREIMNKNIVSFFQQQEQKKQQQKKDQNKEDGDNKDQQDGQSGQNQQNNKQSDSSGQKKEQGQQGSEDEQNKKEENSDQNGNQKDKDQPDEDEQKDKKDNKGQESRNLPRQKLPAKLKQLMSDDRQLQMKMIENGTRDLNRRKSRKSKDW